MPDQSTILAVAIAAASGAIFGRAADRVAARWPARPPGTAIRQRMDWRTAVLVASGAIVFGALVVRWQAPENALLFGACAGLLVLLLATDLDQRLLPDLLTMPLIVLALAAVLGNWTPLLMAGVPGIVSALAAAIGLPLFLVITDRVIGGQLGGGDVKLAIGVGLLAGLGRLVVGFLLASLAFSVVLLVLIALGRLDRRSVVPFGPVLVFTGFFALLAP
jgi:leader peptidase (prepilin peptidase)/N-methyltransferase